MPTNLLWENCNYDNFKLLQLSRSLTLKEKPMIDERLKALWNKGIEMMAQGYT
jgi:hypothetical protein